MIGALYLSVLNYTAFPVMDNELMVYINDVALNISSPVLPVSCFHQVNSCHEGPAVSININFSFPKGFPFG